MVEVAEKLTLNARRAYNLLLHNAHGPDMAVPHQRFTIPLADLKFSHAGNDRLTSAIKSLMRTIVTIRSADRVELVPLLGRTTIADRKNSRGYLTYEFDPLLVDLLRDSQIFAKLQLDVIHAVSSKYALALYEIVASDNLIMRHSRSNNRSAPCWALSLVSSPPTPTCSSSRSSPPLMR
ncbi:RepB family plasmid replication initiator protein [Paracoccus cavernae]|uniref:RepB family plasmid replication initiator protein n=1 Tax=Paracoccus cavernae TaxID=1571207 RepID=UPI00362A145B